MFKFLLAIFVIAICSNFLDAQDNVVKDIEGHSYPTVKVGNLLWMNQNLRTELYSDSSRITEEEDMKSWETWEWQLDTTSKWCYYAGKNYGDTIYGKLYNWWAVKCAKGLCPKGWRLPTKDDWNELLTELDTLKISGKMGDPIQGYLTNKNGPTITRFKVNGSGYCSYDGCAGLESDVYIWSASPGFDSKHVMAFQILMRDDYKLPPMVMDLYKGYGYSCRCVKDIGVK